MKIFNEVTLRRLRNFKKRKSAYYSLVVITIFSLICALSELVANNKPYIMKYRGHYYFPVINDYHPQKLGLNDVFIVDYKELRAKSFSGDDFAIFPPIPYSPYEIDKGVAEFPSPPTREHLMGTDDRGRDVLSRLLYGYRVSMTYALGVWLITYFLGTVAGGFMGYKGGVFDFLSQRFIEVLSSLPYLSVLIILIDIFEPNITLLIVITSIFGWIGISYYMRAEFLKLRNFEFVEAGRALGMSTSRILFKHILPNALGPLITFSPFAIAGGVTALVGLDYLGFGVQPPTPSWGELLNQGKELYSIAWWLALYPSLFLFGTLTFFNLIGEGFRYAFDPKKG